MSRYAALAITGALLTAAGPPSMAGGAPLSPLDDAWTFSAYFENDLFADTDQNYTNGIKLSWTSPEISQYGDTGKIPDGLLPYVAYLPFIHRSGPEQQRNVVLSLGQAMYTPQDIGASALLRDDRPYAGWLYLGVAFQNRNPRRLDDLEVQIGVVGPLSLAEQAQTLVHEARGLIKPRGWSNQISTELAFALVYHRLWRFAPEPFWKQLGFDLVPYVGGAVGTAYTYADAGLMMRLGWNLPGDFGSSPIRPGSDTSAPIDSRRDPRLRGAGLHLFAGVEGRAVARSIFLDGNTFADSHSVDKRHLVGDLAVGLSYVHGGFKLAFARVFRSREFEGQARPHRFGSITASFSY